jgi:hypothetical protein
LNKLAQNRQSSFGQVGVCAIDRVREVHELFDKLFLRRWFQKPQAIPLRFKDDWNCLIYDGFAGGG